MLGYDSDRLSSLPSTPTRSSCRSLIRSAGHDRRLGDDQLEGPRHPGARPTRWVDRRSTRCSTLARRCTSRPRTTSTRRHLPTQRHGLRWQVPGERHQHADSALLSPRPGRAGVYAPQAEALAMVLIPDVLTYSTASTLPAPLNGRGPRRMTSSTRSSISRPAAITRPLRPRRGRRGSGRRVTAHTDYLDQLPVPRCPALTHPRRAAHAVALRSTTHEPMGRTMTATTAPTAPRPRRTRRGIRASGILAAAVAIAVVSFAATIVRPASTVAPRPVVQEPAGATSDAGDSGRTWQRRRRPRRRRFDRADRPFDRGLDDEPGGKQPTTSALRTWRSCTTRRGRLSADLGDQQKALAAAERR